MSPSTIQHPYNALYLYPLNDSFVLKCIPLIGGQRVKIGRHTNSETKPDEKNGFFDSVILSRSHAEVWEESGKIYIRDVKSSNGTFLNGVRLSSEDSLSDPYEIKSNDILEFGVDIMDEDNKVILHHKIGARAACAFKRSTKSAAQNGQHDGPSLTEDLDDLSIQDVSKSAPTPVLSHPHIQSGRKTKHNTPKIRPHNYIPTIPNEAPPPPPRVWYVPSIGGQGTQGARPRHDNRGRKFAPPDHIIDRVGGRNGLPLRKGKISMPIPVPNSSLFPESHLQNGNSTLSSQRRVRKGYADVTSTFDIPPDNFIPTTFGDVSQIVLPPPHEWNRLGDNQDSYDNKGETFYIERRHDSPLPAEEKYLPVPLPVLAPIPSSSPKRNRPRSKISNPPFAVPAQKGAEPAINSFSSPFYDYSPTAQSDPQIVLHRQQLTPQENKSPDTHLEETFPTNDSEEEGGQSAANPTERTVWQLLSATLSKKTAYKALLKSRGEKAQVVLDVLQKSLDSGDTPEKLKLSALSATIRLCAASGVYPQCLELRKVHYDREPIASGSFGEIWKGYLGTHIVCLKVARVYAGSEVEDVIKGYSAEGILWSQLNHPNVLPFYGIYRCLDGRIGRVGLVSPWMQNGNVIEYLRANPEAPRMNLIHDILAGLGYLHEQSVVHGDLKGVNILISPDGSACLADFGLSSVVNPEVLRWTSLRTVTKAGGTARWEAPELMDELEDGTSPRPTFLSDVYSVASVMYEILTGQIPYHEFPRDLTVLSRVMRGTRPSRPTSGSMLELSDEVWEVMEGCWNQNPNERPTVNQVAGQLRQIPPLELTISRIAGHRLRKRGESNAEAEILPPRVFRDAMRGNRPTFSKSEIDLLRGYHS